MLGKPTHMSCKGAQECKKKYKKYNNKKSVLFGPHSAMQDTCILTQKSVSGLAKISVCTYIMFGFDKMGIVLENKYVSTPPDYQFDNYQSLEYLLPEQIKTFKKSYVLVKMSLTRQYKEVTKNIQS